MTSHPKSFLTLAMRHVLARMARAERPHFHTLTADQARAAYAAGADVLEIQKPVLARVEDLVLSTRDGQSLGARLYAPSAQGLPSLPVLLYFHGGGFTIGSMTTHDILCRQLSELSGASVVSLDYRLAPASKFPTAVNDAWDALRWLAENASLLGLDGGRMAVGGDSAGGTLATCGPATFAATVVLPGLRGASGHAFAPDLREGLRS